MTLFQRAIIGFGLMMSVMAASRADEEIPGRRDHAKFRQVLQQCAKQAGVTLPDSGVQGHTRPGESARAKIDECLKQAGFAAPAMRPPRKNPENSPSQGFQTSDIDQGGAVSAQ